MPCSVDDLNITEPEGPSLPAIPGLGSPFTPSLPTSLFPIPGGFPESLNDIFDKLSMILPPGVIKPGLSHSYSKNIFDGILSLLEKFVPFLMLYKFFLPILKLIICMLEVLCSLMNPFKLARAIIKLFRECIPEFLALFPIFALIIMIISLLLLLLAIIEYIIAQILKLIQLILKNIRSLVKATAKADKESVLAIIKKLGMLLCGFQNIFVVLSIVAIIIQAIKDIIKLIFSIPPCDDTEGTDVDGCCTNEVCPRFIRDNETLTSFTGTLQYYSEVNAVSPGFPAPFNTLLNINKRKATHQFFDSKATTYKQFINISDAFDVDMPDGEEKPVFFPVDANYVATTPQRQVPYVVDLRIPYNPADWGRTPPPLNTIINTDNTTTTFTNGINTLTNQFVNTANGQTLSYQIINPKTNEVIGVGTFGFITNATQSLASFHGQGISNPNNIGVYTPFKSIAGLTNYKIVIFDNVNVGNYGVFNIKSVISNQEITIQKPVYTAQNLNNRYVRIKNCIVQYAPDRSLLNFDGTSTDVNTGVLTLVGGKGFEDDGTTVLYGYESDGVTLSVKQATLENFLFTKTISSSNPILLPTDGNRFENVEYTFRIHHEVLLSKSLITLGCLPQVRLNKNFINEVFAGGSALKLKLLSDAINGTSSNGSTFPDVAGLQDCLTLALDAFRANMSEEGAQIFQATAMACLGKTKDDTNSALKNIIGIGFDPSTSTFTLTPQTQFTGKTIKVSVQLNDRNGASITDNLPDDVSKDIASRISGIHNFAVISEFKYDGSRYFEATISSLIDGSGTLQVSFDNQIISVITIPTDITQSPTSVLKELPYSFVYVPAITSGNENTTSDGDTDGAPRRDEADVSRDKS